MKNPRSATIVAAALAAAQGIFGFARAMDWVKVGVDLFGQRLLLVPVVGVVAVARGWVIAVTATLYLLCAAGIGFGDAWLWRSGL